MEIKFEKVGFIINESTPLEKTILNDVSFSLKGNGIYSFVGASNSGKSAIGDLINALITPTKGIVKVGKFTNDGSKIKDIDKLRFETGYVFKNPYDMFFNKTVKKELEFGMQYFKYKMNKVNIRTSDALLLVGLNDEYLNLDPHMLTLVDAKKVALACALIHNPNIIILDEFTCGLGYKDKKDLERLLRLLKTKYNKMIILLTKDTSFAYNVSDEVYLMHATKLVMSKSDKEILRDEELLTDLGLQTPPIASFINACNKKGHEIYHYSNIHDLIKGVYRDVF